MEYCRHGHLITQGCYECVPPAWWEHQRIAHRAVDEARSLDTDIGANETLGRLSKHEGE